MGLNSEHKVRIKDAINGVRFATAYARDPLRSEKVAKDQFVDALLRFFVVLDNVGLLDEMITELDDDLSR